MLRTIFRPCAALAVTAILSGCLATEQASSRDQITQALEPASDTPGASTAKMLNTLPSAVSQTLRPPLSPSSASLFSEEKYDINARQVAAASFFTSLMADSPYSVAVHPEVRGTISLTLKQVTLSQVLDVVSDMYGYDIQKKDQVYRIFPAGMRTETFAVNYLLMRREGATQTSITTGGISQSDRRNNNNQGLNNFSGNSSNSNNLGGSNFSNNNNNGSNIQTRTETDFWSDLQTTLQTLIGTEQGRSVMVTPQAGLVTVRALPTEIRTIQRFLQVSEEIVQRQVILEARIIEVSLDDEYQQGINWTQIAKNADDLIANTGDTDLVFSTTGGRFGNAISETLGGLTSLSFVNQNFSGVVNLLSTQGNVQVLSSPRVTATNNQKAVIKVGDDEYFVTEVSNQNTITSGATTVAPNIELTPFFSGIALDVTPQIDAHGGVLLHVHPSVIETQEQEKIVTLNEERFVLPLAQSNIRESDTVIHAQSGEIVVIGGLMQSVISNQDSKTPLLGDIPIIGNLFKGKRDRESKKELVILLKPTVVGADTWREQLQQSRQQMADFLYVE